MYPQVVVSLTNEKGAPLHYPQQKPPPDHIGLLGGGGRWAVGGRRRWTQAHAWLACVKFEQTKKRRRERDYRGFHLRWQFAGKRCVRGAGRGRGGAKGRATVFPLSGSATRWRRSLATLPARRARLVLYTTLNGNARKFWCSFTHPNGHYIYVQDGVRFHICQQ